MKKSLIALSLVSVFSAGASAATAEFEYSTVDEVRSYIESNVRNGVLNVRTINKGEEVIITDSQDEFGKDAISIAKNPHDGNYTIHTASGTNWSK